MPFYLFSLVAKEKKEKLFFCFCCFYFVKNRISLINFFRNGGVEKHRFSYIKINKPFTLLTHDHDDHMSVPRTQFLFLVFFGGLIF